MPAMVLMERAGLAVFEALREMLPEGGRVMFICGHGNNGGDGFVAARVALEHGYSADCLVTATEPELREECRQQMLQARAQGLYPVFCDDPRWAPRLECLGKYDLIVDAILGLGAEGPLHGPVHTAVMGIRRSGVPVLAVDVPTGIHSDTGRELGDSVWALRTVTFGLPKPYLFQGAGLEYAGYWKVEKIGFPPELLAEPTHARLIDPAWVASLVPERFRDSHKGSNGHVLIVAGSESMRGAAALAARAAIRAGAGLVTVAGIESVCQAVMQHVPEATLIPLPETNGVIHPEAVEIVLAHQSRFTSSLFGPGLTHRDEVISFLDRLWPRWEIASVVDADALNAVSLGLDLPAAPSVLTPHPGEMARLLQTNVEHVQDDRFVATMRAVTLFEQTVLLKGPYSIVGGLDHPMNVNGTGNPGMASAGMGDVLSGTIATLLGQELSPYDAASCGMYWHGLAGDLCACEIGAIGFSARDVAEKLPAARAKLTAP